MRTLKRSASTAVIVATLAGAAALATAAPASAASYHCKTSSYTVDDPSYTGPDSDNWDFDVQLCAKRSGGYIYTTAKVTWDGPYAANQHSSLTFNKARFHLQTKRSTAGKDPVVKYANYTYLEHALEHSSGNGNGSYETGTLKTKASGRYQYLADGYIELDWSGDGAGYHKALLFSASPRV